MLTGAEIFIENRAIVAIGENLDVPEATPLLDLSRFTMLPGLIDMHSHLADRPGSTAELSVYYTISREEQLQQARENAAATLLAGFESESRSASAVPKPRRSSKGRVSPEGSESR